MPCRRTPVRKPPAPASSPSPTPSTSFTPLSSLPRPRRACGPPVRYRDEAHGTTSQGQPPSPTLHTITAAALTTPPPAQSPHPRPAPPPTDVPIPAVPTAQVALALPFGGSAQPAAERQISLLPGSEGAEGVGSQGTQNVPATQLPDITSIPDICYFFSTYPIFGSIFLHAKARKSYKNRFRYKTA